MSNLTFNIGAKAILAGVGIAIIAGTTVPAWAQDAQGTLPVPTPAVQPGVQAPNNAVTSNFQEPGTTDISGNQTADPNAAVCAQQLDDELIRLAQVSQDAAVAQAALTATNLAADIAGLVAEAAGEPDPTGAAAAAGIALQIAAITLQAADLAAEAAIVLPADQTSINLDTVVNGLPECDTTFVGTVRIRPLTGQPSNVGLDVDGESIFRNDVNIVGDIQLKGGIGFDDGIAISGSRTNSATVTDVSAIAIGDNTLAVGAGTVALGRDAQANNAGSIAIGDDADVAAAAIRGISIGANSNVDGDGGVALGDTANTEADGGIAIGDQANANAADGAISIGDVSSVATGAEQGIAIGDGANVGALGTQAIAIGEIASATADAAIAVGDGAAASGVEAIAVGNAAVASGERAVVVGANSVAAFDNSAAFGNGAVTTRANQQVFGNASNTYTMPGITSRASKAFQSGPLEVVTTDANGNLASDGGQLFKQVARNQAGIAIATAMQTPDLTGNESFGFKVSYGNFDVDANAIAITSAGVLGRDVLVKGDRFTVDIGGGAGMAYGFQSNAEKGIYAGRAGVQWTW